MKTAIQLVERAAATWRSIELTGSTANSETELFERLQMLVPFTKSGKRLQGTLERLKGVALVEGKDDDGELVYTGETKICGMSKKQSSNTSAARSLAKNPKMSGSTKMGKRFSRAS